MAFVDIVAWAGFLALVCVRINRLGYLGLFVKRIIGTLLETFIARGGLVFCCCDFVGRFVSDLLADGSFVVVFCRFILALILASPALFTLSLPLLCFARLSIFSVLRVAGVLLCISRFLLVVSFSSIVYLLLMVFVPLIPVLVVVITLLGALLPEPCG